MNLKRKKWKLESGFAWVMRNRGSPVIIDLLYPGLESHEIFKSVGYGKPWKIE